MEEPFPVYVFRDRSFSPGGDSVVAAAPLDLVVSVFGGGGFKGVCDAFGGAAFFRDEETGQCYVGVWGAPKASRFPDCLRGGGVKLDIRREPPPARLIFW